MKSAFWKQDWFLGLIITIVFIAFSGSRPIQSLVYSMYDVSARSTARTPNEKISIIAIDDESINNIGRWPWSRDLHTEMITMLHEAGAKVVGYSIVFSEKQLDPGLDYISGLNEIFKTKNLSFNPPVTDSESQDSTDTETVYINKIEYLKYLVKSIKNAKTAEIITEIDSLAEVLSEIEQVLILAEDNLNVDKKMAESIRKAEKIVMGMWFLPGEQLGNPDQALPDYIKTNAITNLNDQTGGQEGVFAPRQTNKAILPLEIFATNASAIGNLNIEPDIDGGIRREILAYDYYGELYPSYTLQLAAKSLNLNNEDIIINAGAGVQLGRLKIATDEELSMHTLFYGTEDGSPAFSVDSFYDVITKKIPATKYKDKTVIVGPSASGIAKIYHTPVNPVMPEVMIYAHVVSSILNEDFFIIPSWDVMASLGVFLFIICYLMFLLPRFGAKAGAISTSILLLGMIVTEFVLMTRETIWFDLMMPTALLISGHILLSTKRFLVTERGKLHSDLESAESNRMLGLAFQGQGQLDMAFEKFRKCPKDNAISEVMYNLALDYERKRQFSKAGNVYQYIHEFNPKFRDVEQRIARSKKMEETVVLGSSGGTTAAGTLILDAAGSDVEKPMLGRYQVEKELGKGAMGVVYLGKDPKISRVVAIKTMALSQEFDEDELDEVKERFFREAETAGRLNHPNIVTIYDAGEEHDLAYIAMEFLKGQDLSPYTKPDNLLPVDTVIEIISKSAEGLNYAHSQNVVHRDIKPANIMFEPESKQIKITDFGIARITDSSKTKTGMVLGTPSYMSPEQLAGKKVDGRSDLYSLGVMLFQMLAGELPFKADSMATLMYKITNDPHPSILEYKPDLPSYLEIIVAKALEKNPTDRYQTGAELIQDINRLRGGKQN